MPRTRPVVDQYTEIVSQIRQTPPGQERGMYPWIRDLFVEILGHPRGFVRTEPPGDHGAADVDVRAPRPTGAPDPNGGLPVIVIEAKDEHNVVFSAARRERLYREKAKYITFATQWFILIDPVGMVARPVRLGQFGTGDLGSV